MIRNFFKVFFVAISRIKKASFLCTEAWRCPSLFTYIFSPLIKKTIYHLSTTNFYIPSFIYPFSFNIFNLLYLIHHLSSTIFHLPSYFYYLFCIIFHLTYFIYHLSFAIFLPSSVQTGNFNWN